jgi:predicted signal transduction protein with EAL and GGDEF domain
MASRATPRWTSALEVATFSPGKHDDSEGLIMMRNISGKFRHFCQLASMLLSLIVDAVCYLGLCIRPSPAMAAENLFLRKQLALYQERQIKPRRATNATRITLVWLGQWFD